VVNFATVEGTADAAAEMRSAAHLSNDKEMKDMPQPLKKTHTTSGSATVKKTMCSMNKGVMLPLLLR